MKKVLGLLMATVISACIFAQAPSKMSFQSVIRNSTGTLVSNSPISMRISVLQGSASGTIVYMETHSKSTNENGLVSLEIGGGTVVIGTFSGINWSAGTFFLKTETDPTGGTNYTISGTSQLLSVPYALYAEKSGNADNYWKKNATGIYYDSARAAIGTTPNPIVPLTIFDKYPNGNGNAVLHLKSNDTWHTGMTMFNGELPNSKYYSFLITGPANNTSIPGTFGIFNHNAGSWTLNANPSTNNVAIGSTGFNSNNPKSKLHVFEGDVNIDKIGSGIIMKSPNGNCYRVTVDNSGILVSTLITCP